MANSSTSTPLTAAGGSLILALSSTGRTDTRARIHIDGTWTGLVAWVLVANDGNNYDLQRPLRNDNGVYETQTYLNGFSVPDSTTALATAWSWDVDVSNAAAVKFLVQVLGSGSVNARIDSGFYLDPMPAGPGLVYDPLTGTLATARAATQEGMSPRQVPAVGIGLLNAQGTMDRLQGEGGALRVVNAESAFLRFIALELWRVRQGIDSIDNNSNRDGEFPPDWDG